MVKQNVFAEQFPSDSSRFALIERAKNLDIEVHPIEYSALSNGLRLLCEVVKKEAAQKRRIAIYWLIGLLLLSYCIYAAYSLFN